MFTGMGDTPELAKQNMMEQMEFFKEIVKKMNINILYF